MEELRVTRDVTKTRRAWDEGERKVKLRLNSRIELIDLISAQGEFYGNSESFVLEIKDLCFEI